LKIKYIFLEKRFLLLIGLRLPMEFENFKWPFSITTLFYNARGKIYFHCRESYYNAGNMSGCSRNLKSWPTSRTGGTRRRSWLTASKRRAVAAKSLLYTYMRFYIPNGTKLYSSSVSNSLKNLSTSPKLRHPYVCII